MKERIRAWVKQRKGWLIPLVCLILGSLLGGTVEFIPDEEPAPVEVEVWVDDESL